MRNAGRMFSAFLLAAVAGSLGLAQTIDSQPQHEIEARAVYSIPTGETNFSGTTISFSRDFDFPNRINLDLRYTHRSESGKHKFVVFYGRTSHSSTRTLTRTIEFLNRTYTANLEIKSEQKIHDFGAKYAYRWGTEKLRIGPQIELGVVKPSISIATTDNNSDNFREASLTKLAALIGYDIEYQASSQVNLFHSLGAIAFQNDRLFRTEAGLKYFPSRTFGVSGGYKFINYKWVDDPNFLSARGHGPFIGGLVRF